MVATSEVYAFGRFKVDAADWQVRADGATVPLGSPARQLLGILIERAGIVVSKSELIARVWGHAAVGDNVLHVHMTLLRRAIGDECIATKQGIGYRFVAPLRRNGVGAARTPPAPRSEKPRSHGSRLIGRNQSLRDLARLVTRAPLVTLTGPGGVGKTRLMLAAGEALRARFPDGVWLVELAALRDPALVTSAIATVLGVEIDGAQSPPDSLARSLASKHALILLDNCEHLLERAAFVVAAMVAAAPELRIFATSRAPLYCEVEQVFPVMPLDLPSAEGASAVMLRKTAAIEFFLETARASDPDFALEDDELAAAARICRRVDGLPLAIRMVASWAATLGMATLEAKLSHSITSANTTHSRVPERHGTLRATFEWSHDLLHKQDQMLLRRLAAFADRFALDAAEQVVADELLQPSEVWGALCRLVRQSLLIVAVAGRAPKYRMLDTTRAFALEKLTASADGEALFNRHSGYVRDQLQRAEEEWETTSDAAWLERYGALLPDLRGALDWAMGQPDGAALAVALTGASWPLWREFSLRAEGRRRILAALAGMPADVPAEAEARLRQGYGDMLANTADMTRSMPEYARVIQLCRMTGDALGVGRALVGLGYAQLMAGDIAAAEAAIGEACELLENGRWPRALAAACLIDMRIHAHSGRFDQARAAGERARRLCGMAGADRYGRFVMANLMEVAMESGDTEEAIRLGRTLVDTLSDVRQGVLLGGVLANLTAASAERGDLAAAIAHAREAVPLLRDQNLLFWLFDHLALLAGRSGRWQDSALLIGYADAAYLKWGIPRRPNEQRARTRLMTLLDQSIAPLDVAELVRLGTMLNEDRAIVIALAN